MSSSYAAPFGRLEGALDEIAAIDPTYRSTGEKQAALVALARVRARVVAEELRILAAADDVAVATGARSTAAWVAEATRDHPGTVRRHAALAGALRRRWPRVAEALAAGSVSLAQTETIVQALDTLPMELGEDPRSKAEGLLIAEAAHLGPGELRIVGSRLVERVAPDLAEEQEYQQLLAAERRASAATRLSLRRRGDGSTDLRARIPDHAAGRLTAFLNAYTAPRRHHLHDHLHGDGGEDARTPFGPIAAAEPDEFADLPIDRQRGIGFVALLEHIPTDSLPRHGGTATTVTINLDYASLVRDVTRAGLATTSTGDPVTAGQARRWACRAGLVPVVLGGPSEVLDLGRSRRLVTEAIRKALNLRDRGCTALGCTIPAAFCEAHHLLPWSRGGGKTSLQDCTLLCSFHHHRAHDPAWETRHHPHGKTSFHRRT